MYARDSQIKRMETFSILCNNKIIKSLVLENTLQQTQYNLLLLSLFFLNIQYIITYTFYCIRMYNL